jgi:hypothetical protein
MLCRSPVDQKDMGSDSKKTRETGTAKITAAHLAGLRPRPGPESPIGKWDLSTAFVAGFAFAILAFPELTSIFNFGAQKGAPHSATNLLFLLGLVGVFGIFPIVFLHHLYLQNFSKSPGRIIRAVAALVALAIMTFTTGAIKPLLGYDQKLADDSRYVRTLARSSAIVGEASRSPASAPAEAIREGTELFR